MPPTPANRLYAVLQRLHEESLPVHAGAGAKPAPKPSPGQLATDARRKLPAHN